MFIHYLVRFILFYRLAPASPCSRRSFRSFVLTRVLSFDGDAGLQWVVSSCYYLRTAPSPKTLSDLHRPLRRAKRAAIPNGVCVVPHTTSSVYIYNSDGSLPRTPPPNFRFQITGNLAVYGFAFPPVPWRCILSPLPDFCALSFFVCLLGWLVGFQGRRDCNFSTNAGVTSCLDGGCNGGLQCDPKSGTVRLSIPYTTITLTHLSSLPSFALGNPHPCRVNPPRQWRNGRLRASIIRTFTTVRASIPSSGRKLNVKGS
jgi:hypothetical protein